MSKEFSYDSVPYPSMTFPKTSPERLATHAAANGLNAADPRECSYLELGCGDGTNLLAHAFMYPESTFLGVDLSQTHIDSANAAVAELGIKNITFRQMDVMDLAPGALDKFDYIVAHGLFSWVPLIVRQRLLEIYSEYLAPMGVGYISYNTFPGCHLRAITNEMMRFHTRNQDEAIEKVNSGASLLKFIGDVTEPDSSYHSIVLKELEEMTKRSPQNIYHDDLSEVNDPVYFYQFAEQLASRGMQYLSEAEEVVANTANLSGDAIRRLDTIASDLVEREQYLDFIRCRRFRSTLFCRDDISLDRSYLQDHLSEYYFAGYLQSESAESRIASEEPEIFFGPKKERIECNHPLTRAAIHYLSAQWSRCVRFDEVIKRSVDAFGLSTEFMSDSDVIRTRDFFIELVRVKLFRLHRYPNQRSAFGVSEKPSVSRFARWQVERGSRAVMTYTGLSLEPENDVVRFLLGLVDGTRSHDDLVNSMMENLESATGDQTQVRDAVDDFVATQLEMFAKNGLLEA